MTVNGLPVGTTYHRSNGMSSVLIIGAGNFGAATALSLAKKGGVQVTLVDTAAYPSPRAASHDVNKIVRDDYPDTLYMKMLLRAMPMWRTNELYSPWYHEVGMLRADPSNFGERSIAAYKELGTPNDSHYLSVDEVRKRWNGAFATSNFDGVDKVLYNPSVGFAEADKALGAVVQAAVNHGVDYVVGEVTSLTFGPSGETTGVSLQDGRVLQANKIVLAAGARTATLLAQSAPKNKKLHAGDRILATGAVSFQAKLHGAQKEKFETIPVLKSCLPQVKGMWISIVGPVIAVGACPGANVLRKARACPFSRMALSSSTATCASPTMSISHPLERRCLLRPTSPCTTCGQGPNSSPSSKIARARPLMGYTGMRPRTCL